ncbi:YbaK/aminoacyl-tRNA synthetase-associated domain-containing protein, partial [Parasitella parasitica]
IRLISFFLFSLISPPQPPLLFVLYKMATCDAVLEALGKLSITPKTVSHNAVSDSKAWTEALGNTNQDFHVTKTLILKPKTAKTAPVTPVVVIALESTETNTTALGKKLSLKDCRFASEDLLKGTFGVNKDSVSPFALSNVQDISLVHLVVDNAILALDASTLLAFHPSAADKTVFITVDQLKSYFASINKEFIDTDFKALAAAKPPPNAVKKAPKATKEGTLLHPNSERNTSWSQCD